MRRRGWIAIWSMLFFTVDAEIKCHFENGRQDIQKCEATDEYDNILRRGLVSDKITTARILLYRCQIQSVEREAFFKLPAVEYLDLIENKIQSLQLGVFDELTSLSHLFLSHNLLTELPVGIFQHNTKLFLLDLDGNRLKTLEPGLFDSVPHLFQLNLRQNSFTGKDLVPALFQRNRYITRLILSGNDMIDANFLSTMNNLNLLFMDNCLFKEVPKLATAENMKRLKHLNLDSNEITSIDDATTFSYLIDIKNIVLSRNKIEFIHNDAFKNLKKLESLDLSNNKLKILPVDMFQNLRQLYQLSLSNNLLSDIPPNAFAGTTMKRLSFDNNNITHLHEHFLSKIQDAGLILRILHFKNNPWQCACLRELLQEVKRTEILYDADSYDGKHPVCVTGKDFYCRRDEAAHDQFIRMYNESIQ